ncbi:hypothetical protein GGR53DRAFT_152805 [Hypoxylon sp. FL1150]|nr:hypothetical protein GGR53DRAFT_152805 [Hypoxylon sp. FL1150]
MGRKPNPLFPLYFDRGPKLQDNSNRYPHRCKACGENFPKGRSDALINHLTKKCPAISQEDRINACLALHGIKNGANRNRFDGLLHTGPNAGPPPAPALTQPQSLAPAQEPWPPLAALANIVQHFGDSNQHANHESSRDPTTEAVRTTLAAAVPVTSATNPFEPHGQFTLENPPMSIDNRSQQEQDVPQQSQATVPTELSTEDRLHELLQNATSPTQPAVDIAVAAAARLDQSILSPHLDPQLVAEEAIPEPVSQAQSQSHLQSQLQSQAQSADMMINYPSSPERQPAPAMTNVSTAAPWEGMAYMAEGIHAPATINNQGQQMEITLNKGGFRMDTSDGLGSRHRHSRARYEHGRRKEVREIRRIGACIRCRILRKTCSPGTPCDACKKVLSPRVWRTGCVRTKLCDYINLYSAKVQAVMSQKRINNYKSSHQLENVGTLVEVSHFPETGHKAVFQVLQGKQNEGVDNMPDGDNPGRVLLLDYDNEDISGKVEAYMRQTLNELISREPSHYVRVTLKIATMVAEQTNDELLKRSLELWGIVEMMDRERQWTMLVKSSKEGVEDYWIKDDSDTEAYTNICMQLTAAAEHKADTASQSLLKGIQQNLQDGKIKLGFPMFLTVMLFLNCMEKTTWAFKAWDEENLRPKWPLQKPPSDYTHQGEELMELLRMLLTIRHVLPRTVPTEDADTPMMADENDPMIQKFFQDLGVTSAYLHTRLEPGNFQPTDSRSLEFLFCAPLLLSDERLRYQSH